MLDLISDTVQIPWECGERDCSQQWHLSQYDYDEDGLLVMDGYCDGDWEPSDDEMPTQEEIDHAWTTYYRYVADTGDDVLNQIFGVERETSHEQTWKALVKDTPEGIQVTRCKRGKRYFHPRSAPEEVQEYLLLEPRPTNRWFIDGIKDLDTLRESAKIDRWGYVTFTVTVKKPRNENTVLREIKREARRRLKIRETA